MPGFSKAAIGRRMASKGMPPQFGKKKKANPFVKKESAATEKMDLMAAMRSGKGAM